MCWSWCSDLKRVINSVIQWCKTSGIYHLWSYCYLICASYFDMKSQITTYGKNIVWPSIFMLELAISHCDQGSMRCLEKWKVLEFALLSLGFLKTLKMTSFSSKGLTILKILKYEDSKKCWIIKLEINFSQDISRHGIVMLLPGNLGFWHLCRLFSRSMWIHENIFSVERGRGIGLIWRHRALHCSSVCWDPSRK